MGRMSDRKVNEPTANLEERIDRGQGQDSGGTGVV